MSQSQVPEHLFSARLAVFIQHFSHERLHRLKVLNTARL
jgi:hypothetical protein